MPRAGLPDDDLAPAPPERARRSPARAAGSVLAALAVVGLALPGHHDRAAGTSDRRLELVGGPTTTVEVPTTPTDVQSAPPTSTVGADGSGPGPTGPTTTEALVTAQALRPVSVLDQARAEDDDAASSSPSSSRSSATTAPPFLPGVGQPRSTTTTAGPGGPSGTTAAPGSGSTPGGGGSTTTTRGSTTTTGHPATTAPTTQPPRTTTTRPPTMTTRPPTTTTTRPPTTTTTTTTRPPTTTTTRPPTTTTTEAPCRPGVLEPERSSFVFDGQSNSLSPTPETAYPAKLMAERWPDRAGLAVNRAVVGSTYDDRAGWADRQTDPWIVTLRQPCAVLLQEGGPADLLADLPAAAVLDANRRYTQARRAAGFDVIVGATVPPGVAYSPAQDAQRLAYNSLLRAHWRDIGLDALVDVAAIPQLQDPGDPHWFHDGNHFTDAGSTVVADLYARQL